MKVIVTGAAGFIGSHVAQALLKRGDTVVGIDNLNSYYDPALKQDRLAWLAPHPGFQLVTADVADRHAVQALSGSHADADAIVHLAAQAGVRHSVKDPYTYVDANVMGQVVMLELARQLPRLRHFVYASSSSVYGRNVEQPFAVEHPVQRPASIYAATKLASEHLADAYSWNYRIAATGLRFFTVYGPWGRPDMAYFLFARAIADGRPITVFNNGQMKRDFTYIDDIVRGVLAAVDRPPQADAAEAPHRVYNLGNNRPEHLLDFINLIEREMGRSADKIFAPMQVGDVPETAADITASTRDLGYSPSVPISEGLPRFVEWFKRHYRIN